MTGYGRRVPNISEAMYERDVQNYDPDVFN